MIQLVKSRCGETSLVSATGEVEIQDCGVLIKFKSQDNRKHSYTVLLHENAVVELVGDLLKMIESD